MQFWGDSLIDSGRWRLLEVVATAAQDYRESMKRYIKIQADLLNEGVPPEEIFERSQAAFAAVAAAEDALDDALVVLDWLNASASSTLSAAP